MAVAGVKKRVVVYPNTLIRSVFNALSISGGLVAAVLLCIKRGRQLIRRAVPNPSLKNLHKILIGRINDNIFPWYEHTETMLHANNRENTSSSSLLLRRPNKVS